MYDGEPAVKKLLTENFPTGKDGHVWLIEFYAPWWCVVGREWSGQGFVPAVVAKLWPSLALICCV